MSDLADPPTSPAVGPATRIAPNPVGLVASLIAALAVGTVAATSILSVGRRATGPYAPSDGISALDVAMHVVVLVAIAVALLQPVRRFGWLFSAAGAFGLAALYAQGNALTADQLYTLVAVATGLQFGGALLALAAASPGLRWAIAGGLGVGLAAGVPLLVGLAQLIQGWGMPDARAETALTVFAAVILVAGLVVVFTATMLTATTLPATMLTATSPAAPPAERPAEPPAAAATRSPRVAVIAVVVVTIVSAAIELGWQAALERMAETSTGGISQSDAESIETWDRIVRVGTAAAIAAVLLVVAYRRGGVTLARLVAVMTGAGAVGLALPLIFVYSRGHEFRDGLLPAALGGLVALAGMRYGDRRLPWEAAGLLLVLLPVTGTTPGQLSFLMVPFGLGLALAAGFANLTATLPDGSPGPGLGAAEVAVSAGLGVAALQLSQQAMPGMVEVGSADQGGLLRPVSLVMMGAVVTLVVLSVRAGRSSASERPTS